MINSQQDFELTEQQIEQNLKLVEQGKPLTIPLAVLNGEFKKRYFKCKNCGKTISEGNIIGFCYKCNPEVKKKQREYQREYYQKPEVKKKQREYQREYSRKKLKIPKSKWRVK